ncbi:MAG: cupin domain-containing protein [Proteobacteria bacterium]|nr:cupin domain-containing protein [Pseudomonadota bacterium]MBU2260617.1 cupin domain-containing protein [Pseudomonadota bacterium]
MGRKQVERISLGQRMKAGREKMGMSIEDLALETGYLPEVLNGVEEDRTVPPVSLVLQLSRVLKLNVDELEAEQQAQATRRRSKSHKKRVDSYAYTPLSKPGPDKHLRGYLVTVDAFAEHKGVEYHHEGEEFVYVLKGGITIQIGDNVSKLSKGESIHFNSVLHHKLSNPNRETAELLVVVYVP